MAGTADVFSSDLSNEISEIKKREGRIVNFESSKISNAIYKALIATKRDDYTLADRLAGKVLQRLVKQDYNVTNSPSVEDVQDMVESVLIEEGLSETAKAYILYRHERRKIREDKMKILERTSLDEVDKAFNVNSLRVLASRYLLRDQNGRIVESPNQLLERVAITVTLPDVMRDQRIFDLKAGVKQSIEEISEYLQRIDELDKKYKIGSYVLNKWHIESLLMIYKDLSGQGQMKVTVSELLQMFQEDKFNEYAKHIDEYKILMVEMTFLPNSPTLMNAGTRLGQLSACFVLDMKDDMAHIMKSSTDAALIFKSGGGVGINYSDLRPEGDIVASTSGVASGPASFMRIIDTVTDVVKQGGKRRGANMGILESWHPDIESFVVAKSTPGVFENFNVSVGMWEDFWDAMRNKMKYPLRNPRTGAIVKHIDANQLIDLIALSAWKSAEPGVLFFDNMNKHNVMKRAQGLIRATNPCGEQSLYPYESCNLGSINLANLVKRRVDGGFEFDWQRYEQVIRLTTRFLDNIIDANKYPIAEIDISSKLSRRIGLGIMGLADLLFKLKIQYNSKEGYELSGKLAETLSYYSMEESVEIARNRGTFPMFNDSDYVHGKLPVEGYYAIPKNQHSYDWDSLIDKITRFGIRNSQTTTVAPTGTLSMLADCSNGVEPMFALVFEKRVTVGRFFYTNKILENVLKEDGLYSDELLEKISANYGSMKGFDYIPEWVQNTFVTAMDIHWADHLMAQAVWQRWVSNAIAKTINMPNDVTVEDVKCSYLLSHELGLKGVTIYRDGSRHQQVLHIASDSKERTFEVTPSNYVVDYVMNNIKDEFIQNEVMKVIRVKSTHEYLSQPMAPHKEKEEEPCPVCDGKIAYIEGCNCCIECGWSSCVAG
ncbi:MAG: adenosylcobalamin-dependent ribonucleoside-diphosphate reductase [Thaumarchaeota archaeon]|nr:adenosylcobalamin-dependent ribonucleoside-diphosphate reductase [Nitrososphaerota archaeon]